MSVQAVAPHSLAINAINKISVRSCSALSARGAGNSEKHSANPFIGRSLQIRSSLQNPLSLLWQLLTEYHMRFPCPPGEGEELRYPIATPPPMLRFSTCLVFLIRSA